MQTRTPLGLLLVAAALFACASGGQKMSPNVAKSSPSAKAADASDNPLLRPWPGPHGGLPPFDQVKLAHFRPALELAMTETLTELDRIAANAEAPTFENTYEPLERAFARFDRVKAIFGVWGGALNTPEFQSLQREMTPKLAAFADKVTQNAALFARLERLRAAGLSSLDAEQRRLERKTYEAFVRAGARLDAKAKARLSAINQQLASLMTRFGQNVLGDETDRYLLLDKEADLAGLPPSLRAAAAAAAKARKLSGKWVIRNTRSSIDPFLTYSDRRDLREKAWRLFVGRGDGGGKTDNKSTITELLALRAERAQLLGQPTHAHWRLQNTMAKSPEAVLKLLEAVWKPATARAREEVADMQALADRAKAKIRIAPWDYRYYAEKVRKAKYDLDDSQIKPYLQLDKLREGMFWVAGRLFGLGFERLESAAVFHADVTVWLVSDRQRKAPVGLFYFDPYARPGKRSGAWMAAYRKQAGLDGALPMVSNNCNFIKGKPGTPTLISWDDAQTLFHEFGHALHGLLSKVTYPSLSGTSVLRDYVELPSQLLEHWLLTPEVLQRFALHVETAKPMPQDLVKRIERAATFNQGFGTVEYLASALYDIKIHLSKQAKIDPATFERETLTALGLPKEIVMRHRPPHFLHIFASDSYSAGYYSYLWADVLTADAFEAFSEGKGPYDAEVAKRLLSNILAAGDKTEPAEAYRRFRGRDATVDALMRKRGFAPSRKR